MICNTDGLLTDVEVNVTSLGLNIGQPEHSVERRARSVLADYRRPTLRQSSWQIANTLLPFLACWYLAYLALSFSVILALVFEVLAAGLVVRIYIIQHDCGHNSYFASRAANEILGVCCGIVTMTPFYAWRRRHLAHHRTTNNIDQLSKGLDSDCMMQAHYWALPPWKRRLFRLMRQPLIMYFVIAPMVLLVLQRLPIGANRGTRRESINLHLTNFILLATAVVVGSVVGFGTLAAVHIPIVVTAGAIGLWLCTIEHRFAGSRWFRNGDWNVRRVALEGTSHLLLPSVLQWFSGNISIHHIHHFDPSVPNYNLPACLRATDGFFDHARISLRDALSATAYHLWDEKTERLMTFREAANARRRG